MNNTVATSLLGRILVNVNGAKGYVEAVWLEEGQNGLRPQLCALLSFHDTGSFHSIYLKDNDWKLPVSKP